MISVANDNIIQKDSTERLHVCVGFVCNNLCMFCIDSKKDKPRLFEKLGCGEIYAILRDNRGMKRVCFTRGEPTLNPNLTNYVKYAQEQGYKEIEVVSNGRQYRDTNYCLDLIRAGVRKFTVSVHGHNARIHDALTRSAGSFAQTVQGLKNLSRFRRTLPIKIHVSHVVNKINYKFLHKFLEFMAQYLIDGVILNTVQPRGEYMDENSSILMPKYKDVARKMENIFEKRSELLKSNLPFSKCFVSIIDMPLCISRR